MIVLALLLSAFVGLVQAPLPTKLLEAKTAYIVNAGTKQEFVDKLYLELKKTKRFELVADEDKADILILLTDKKSGAVTVPVANMFVTVEGEGFSISILERETRKPLWSDSQAVNWTYGGAVSALVKRLDKRLGKRR